MLRKISKKIQKLWRKHAKKNQKTESRANYEQISSESNNSSFLILDKREDELLLPLLIKMLNHREGKEKVFSNTKIRQVFLNMGEEVSDLQIRKLVYYIRNKGLIELLIANSEGYYVAEHSQDIEQWLNRQRNKIDAMKHTINAIQSQYEDNVAKIKTGKSKLYPQMTLELW